MYTEPYATNYPINKENAIAPFIEAAQYAKGLGLGVNAGHDLSLENLAYFSKCIPWIEEVSIGHCTYLRCPLFWIATNNFSLQSLFTAIGLLIITKP